MKLNKLILTLVAAFIATGMHAATVNTSSGTFVDTKRNRDVPYKIYYPNLEQGTYPVIIFSHGLGGSCNGYSYFGEYMAQHGYICIHIQHKGSDSDIWKNASSKMEVMQAMKRAVMRPKTSIDRFKDIPFTIDQIAAMNQSSPIFKGHIDVGSIGIAGHSFGAQTVLFAAGQKTVRGGFQLNDTRIKAGIALSPNAPESFKEEDSDIYNDIKIPLLHITGTNDDSPLAESKSGFTPANRTIPYQKIKNAPQYLIVFDQATHMTFSGRDAEASQDPFCEKHLENVLQSSLAFFDCYLKGEKERGAWLKKEFVKSLAQKDRFEWK